VCGKTTTFSRPLRPKLKSRPRMRSRSVSGTRRAAAPVGWAGECLAAYGSPLLTLIARPTEQGEPTIILGK
jgi:hypothetical protein